MRLFYHAFIIKENYASSMAFCYNPNSGGCSQFIGSGFHYSVYLLKRFMLLLMKR